MSGVSDTNDAARARQRDVMRRLDGSARLRMALEMSDFVRDLSLRRIRLRQPALSAEESVSVLLHELYPTALPHGS